MECPECGAENPESSRFCGLCYHPFEPAAAAGDTTASGPPPPGPVTDLLKESTGELPDYDAIVAASFGGRGSAGFDPIADFPMPPPSSGYGNWRMIGIVIAAVLLVVTFVGALLLIPSLTGSRSDYESAVQKYNEQMQEEYNQQGRTYYPDTYTTPYRGTTPSSTPGTGPPVITGMSPSKGSQGMTVSANVSGDNFKKGLSISLMQHGGSAKVSGSSVILYGDDVIRCQFSLTGCPPGLYDLRIVNSDGFGMEAENAFEIE